MLDNLKWYRKLRGGLWRKVMIKRFNVSDFWTRNRTPFNEEVVAKEEDYRFSDNETDSLSFINTKIKTTGVCTDLISDGYHTFGELYLHRIELWIALCKIKAYQNVHNRLVWRSKLYQPAVGEDYIDWDGWFVLGIGTIEGTQMSYKLPMSNWDDCNFCATLEKAPAFDGHTSQDVLHRIQKYL
jgi:hypothetical protein